ncbi:MAG: 50S ribosomal protein L23 [Thermoplasmataceae archaeon]
MVNVIISPIATEKSMLAMEKENKLTFLVLKKASKSQIKEEVEKRFELKVLKVNTVITKNGKKAIVELDESYSADEIAGRIGVF